MKTPRFRPRSPASRPDPARPRLAGSASALAASASLLLALPAFGPDVRPAAAQEPSADTARASAGRGAPGDGPESAGRAGAAARRPAEDDGWNSPRVRELIASAIDARRRPYADSTLRAFEADVQGHVYFLGGIGAGAAGAGASGGVRPLSGGIAGAGEGLQVIRADQVALRVRWNRGEALQTIVGRRSEKRLPTRIRYHIDHLSLVLDNFGDRISLGEGTEVQSVLHPVAPGALEHYDYRLADSLGIGIAGETRRLYRIDVRPRDPADPGVVGEIRIERRSRAVARMHFTFTRSAYRDPDVESIQVDLQSALWEGRHWLPAEQRVVVRRRIRWLDFPLAGIIRTHLKVSDYRINPDSMPPLPPDRRVVSLPEDRLKAFSGWSEGLYDGPIGSGEAATVDAGALRERAREMVRERALAWGGRLAPSFAGLSELFRARRAEGGMAGLGARYRLGDGRTVSVWTGRAMASGATEWRVAYRGSLDAADLELEGYGDRPGDVGPFPAAAGLVSTLGFVLRGEDFLDPYFRDGGRATVGVPVGDAEARIGATVERHEPAAVVADPPGDDVARPVRRVEEGTLGALTLGWREPLGSLLAGTLSLDLRAEAATDAIGDFGFTRLLVGLDGRSGPRASPWAWQLHGGLGVVGGAPPPQRLLLLGGRGTVPGYAFRRWGGDRAAHLRVEAARQLVGPWVQLRAIAAAGWVGMGGPGAGAAAAWYEQATRVAPVAVTESGGVRPSLGLGLGFFDGVLRVDAVRGLEAGRWEWMVSVDPRFWGVL